MIRSHQKSSPAEGPGLLALLSGLIVPRKGLTISVLADVLVLAALVVVAAVDLVSPTRMIAGVLVVVAVLFAGAEEMQSGTARRTAREARSGTQERKWRGAERRG